MDCFTGVIFLLLFFLPFSVGFGRQAFALLEAPRALRPVACTASRGGACPFAKAFEEAARGVAYKAASKRLKNPTAMVLGKCFGVRAIGHCSMDEGTHTGTIHTHTRSNT